MWFGVISEHKIINTYRRQKQPSYEDIKPIIVESRQLKIQISYVSQLGIVIEK